MIDLTQASAALLLGLSGAGHCLGMCGGIGAGLALGDGKVSRVLAYHVGRLASYTFLGGLLGYAAGSVDIAPWTLGLRYLAGLLLIAMGLYVGGWWLGMTHLERAGSRLWQPVQRLGTRLLPMDAGWKALALGSTWGLMPCGLIYSALAWSATAQSAPDAALLMLLFGTGTLPAMLTASLAARQVQQVLQRKGFKRIVAALLIAAGCWTLYITVAHSAHLIGSNTGESPGAPHQHSHH